MVPVLEGVRAENGGQDCGQESEIQRSYCNWKEGRIKERVLLDVSRYKGRQKIGERLVRAKKDPVTSR